MTGIAGCTKRSQIQPGQQQAWQAMRILRRFTLPQLLTTCPRLAHRTARAYLARLRRCGYVVRVARRISGQPGGADSYSLVRNSGPQAPIARKATVSVFDPNTGLAWGDGGAQLDEAARVPDLPPPTNTMRAALVLLLDGLPPQHVLPDPSNAGALAAVMKALRKRGLVDEAGALTDAGREMALAGRAVWAQICPPGWQP
jgi:hypothetical protein